MAKLVHNILGGVALTSATGAIAAFIQALDVSSQDNNATPLFILAGVLVVLFLGAGLGWYFSKGDDAVTVPPEPPNDDNSAKSINQQGGITANRIDQVVYNQNTQSATDAETNRRKNLLAQLRQEYILSHDGLSPAFLAGLEPLPAEWVNTRLEQLGESWRVD